MRPIQLQNRPKRDNLRRINLRVRHVIVPLDMIQVHRRGNARLLVKIAQITIQRGIIHNAPKIAFEVPVIHRVESNQRAEQLPIRIHNPVPEEKTTRSQPAFQFIQRLKQPFTRPFVSAL